MGIAVNNTELVSDYATGQHYVRFHRDIQLTPDGMAKVKGQLDARQWDSVVRYLKAVAPINTHDLIDVFISSLGKHK